MSRYELVVLVDDNEHDNFINERFLTLAGWAERVRTFSGGDELLTALPSLDPPPDVLFVDLNMPGMNGFELLEKLADTDFDLSATRVIVLTSSVHPVDRERAAATSMIAGYVEKPLGLDMLERLAADLAD